MSELTVGIVGAGGMGATHARSFARLDGVRVVGIADLVADKAAALAEKYGAKAFDSLDALLADGVPDIVSVCVPTNQHRALTEQALTAGAHALCEKPMALTVADCDAMIAAGQASQKLVSVGQCVRFFPEYASAKRLVNGGAVGAPAVIRCRRGGGFPKWSPWFADPAQSGGVIFDLAVHEIDWLLWVFGPVTRVYGKSLTASLSGDDPRDYCLLTLRHASGAISHVESCWADPASGYTAYEIAGDQGLLAHDSRKVATLIRSTTSGRATMAPLDPDDDPYHRQAAAFIAAVRGDAPLAVTAEQARDAIAVAAAAAHSAATGKAVNL